MTMPGASSRSICGFVPRHVADLDAAALRQQVADVAALLGAQDQHGDATLAIAPPKRCEDQ
ncbi:hypothetical protein ACWCPS_04365 [Streptomyces mauvecolor]